MRLGWGEAQEGRRGDGREGLRGRRDEATEVQTWSRRCRENHADDRSSVRPPDPSEVDRAGTDMQPPEHRTTSWVSPSPDPRSPTPLIAELHDAEHPSHKRRRRREEKGWKKWFVGRRVLFPL